MSLKQVCIHADSIVIRLILFMSIKISSVLILNLIKLYFFLIVHSLLRSNFTKLSELYPTIWLAVQGQATMSSFESH